MLWWNCSQCPRRNTQYCPQSKRRKLPGTITWFTQFRIVIHFSYSFLHSFAYPTYHYIIHMTSARGLQICNASYECWNVPIQWHLSFDTWHSFHISYDFSKIQRYFFPPTYTVQYYACRFRTPVLTFVSTRKKTSFLHYWKTLF